jgi:D-alanine-D-alanine ligase
MKRFGKVGVLMGGFSAEREISLMSGKGVYEALCSLGVDAHAVEVGPNFLDVLAKERFDRVFNVLHGSFGEDGTLQGILDFLHIPYTGSGILGSAVSMDKVLSKHLFRDCGIPTPEFVLLDLAKPVFAQVQTLGLPLAIKPVSEGSTIGVSKVSDYHHLDEAVQKAKQYGSVMAERWIEGDEYTVGIIGHEVLPSICIQVKEGFYDYQQKYFVKTNRYHCPSGLDQKEEAEIGLLAYRVFQTLKAKHWGRVDILRDASGKFYVLELNTAPGMTPTSLIPKAAAVLGWTYAETVLKILEQTLKR